jgi:hypothetical protein
MVKMVRAGTREDKAQRGRCACGLCGRNTAARAGPDGVGHGLVVVGARARAWENQGRDGKRRW